MRYATPISASASNSTTLPYEFLRYGATPFPTTAHIHACGTLPQLLLSSESSRHVVNTALMLSLLELYFTVEEIIASQAWSAIGPVASAIFYMDYSNKQESVDIDNSDGAFGSDPAIGIITNAASVDIYGVELELRAQPWEGGFVSVDLGYLKSESAVI